VLSGEWPTLRSTQSLSGRPCPTNQSNTVASSGMTSRESTVAQPIASGIPAVVSGASHTDDQLIHSRGTEWAAVTSTPTVATISTANRYAVLSTDDDDRDNTAQKERFTTVVPRRNKRRQRSTPILMPAFKFSNLNKANNLNKLSVVLSCPVNQQLSGLRLRLPRNFVRKRFSA